MLEVKYFVLRPGKDDPHGRASRAALWEYAAKIEQHDPTLARQLREWVERSGGH